MQAKLCMSSLPPPTMDWGANLQRPVTWARAGAVGGNPKKKVVAPAAEPSTSSSSSRPPREHARSRSPVPHLASLRGDGPSRRQQGQSRLPALPSEAHRQEALAKLRDGVQASSTEAEYGARRRTIASILRTWDVARDLTGWSPACWATAFSSILS